MSTPYATEQPERSAIDSMNLVAIEFGTDWCGFCRAGSPHIAAALKAHPEIAHVKVEDGSGRKLGRAFKVKLWPTVVLVRHGQEVARVVRPGDADEVREALAQAGALQGRAGPGAPLTARPATPIVHATQLPELLP